MDSIDPHRSWALSGKLIVTWLACPVAVAARPSRRATIKRLLLLPLVAGLLGTMVPTAIADVSLQEPAQSNWLLGGWARDSDACRQPEFTFGVDRAAIFVEADGEPVSFVYPAVSYLVSGGNVTVSLGKRHPMAKTPSKTELHFQLRPDGLALLQLLKGRVSPYVRCRPEESN